MTPPAILVESVWKKFRRGESHDALKDYIPALARRMFRGKRDELDLDKQEFWAVRDVSFEVYPGEAVAVIGPNGAGKSTTLKLLSRILRPNKGRCVVRGRVGALIEVAAGFHPDLTGRENVFLQGAIMGMRRDEIRRRFDEIVEFANVAEFIDTPVKRYSSGMHARLGFSIAAHLDPDVLIIDEVLSVGDMAFQQKCVDRAKEYRRRGIAIVFVSHNLQAVTELCNRAVYLAREVRAIGPTDEVLTKYLQSMAAHESSSDSARIVEVTLLNARSAPTATAVPGEPLTLRVTYEARHELADCDFAFVLHRSTDNLRVLDSSFSLAELGRTRIAAGERFTIDFDFRAHLARGQYHVQLHIGHSPTKTWLAYLNPAALLGITEMRSHAGVADLDLSAKLASGTEHAARPALAVARG